MDDPNKPETEEEGIRQEALRRLQVRRTLQVPRGQTRASLPLLKVTLPALESTFDDPLNLLK